MLTPKHVQKHAAELIDTWRKCGRTGLTANVMSKFLRTPTAVVCKALIADKKNFSPFLCSNIRAIVWVGPTNYFFTKKMYGNLRNGDPITREQAETIALDDCKKHGRTAFRYYNAWDNRPADAEPDMKLIDEVAERLKAKGQVFIPEKTISDKNCPYCKTYVMEAKA